MAGNGGRARGKGFGRLTRAGLFSLAGEGLRPLPAQTHAGRPDGTPLSPASL